MDQGRQHQEAEERTRSICEARLAEVHKEAAALRAKVDKLEAQSVKVGWTHDDQRSSGGRNLTGAVGLLARKPWGGGVGIRT